MSDPNSHFLWSHKTIIEDVRVDDDMEVITYLVPVQGNPDHQSIFDALEKDYEEMDLTPGCHVGPLSITRGPSDRSVVVQVMYLTEGR